MRTLRGRLTLSAAVPVALTLILVAIALNLLAFAFVVRSTTDAVARSVRLAETIAAERRNLPYDRLTDEIGRRAYEIYLERGVLPGQELEDWLQAEREIESAAHFMRATIGEKHRP